MKTVNILFLFINTKCRNILEQILLVCLIPSWSSQASEAHRVKVGSYFWISRRSRSLSLRARSRATRVSLSCDSRACSCNGRISRLWNSANWEDMVFEQTADVITTLVLQSGLWHQKTLHCLPFKTNPYSFNAFIDLLCQIFFREI